MAYVQAHRLPLSSEPSLSCSKRSQKANHTFNVDQIKLNPEFEAYKLIQDSISSCNLKSYGLPSQPPRLIDLYQPDNDQKRFDGNLTFTGLGYRETKERALHQVLIPSFGQRNADEPFATYIDANHFVVALTYNSAKDKVIGHPVHHLDQQEIHFHIGFKETLPSLVSISPTEWVLSAASTVQLLKLHKLSIRQSGATRWTAQIDACWKLPLGDKPIGGATIKACKKLGRKVRVLLQSLRTVTATGSAEAKEGMHGLGFQQGTQQHAQGSKAAQSGHSHTSFEVRLIEFDDKQPAVSTNSDGQEARQRVLEANLLWTVQGEEPLIMAKLEEQESLLAAEAPFSSFGEPSSQLSTDIAGPSSAISPASEWNPTSRGRRQAPHFSWAQTGDTVTIAFTLPPWITKSHIRAHFSLGALSVSFTQEALDLLNAPASAAITEIDTKVAGPSDANDELTNAARMIASGRYVSRSTWAEIDPTGSVWTVEKASKMSLLTLHLEKRHEGTRWMQVFANRTGTRPDRKRNFADSETMNRSTTKLSFPQARFKFESVATGRFGELDGDRYDEKEAEGEDAEDNEDDIPETMDPSELISMLEGMQKYTVDEESAQQGADYGFDRTGFTSSSVHGQNGGTSLSLDQPSLLKEGLEEEDANVGRDFVVSVISHSLSDSNEMHSSKSGEKIMLATGLPGNYCDMEAVVIKHDLDGAIFTLKAGQWKHVATMPALAFVLASKRDAQRVHLYQRRDKSGQEGEYAVLAFEGAPQVTGSGGSSAAAAGAGNLFVYYSPSSSGARHAPSRVVRLGATESANAARNGSEEGADAASGALLGVCSVRLSRAGSQSDGSVETMDETLVCLCENRILLLRGVL